MSESKDASICTKSFSTANWPDIPFINVRERWSLRTNDTSSKHFKCQMCE